MAFGSFLRGAFAQVNPFDSGRTYSSVQDEDRRKREAQQLLGRSKSSQAVPLTGISINQSKKQPSISLAKPKPTPKINISNLVSRQQLNVPKFTGEGVYSWNKPEDKPGLLRSWWEGFKQAPQIAGEGLAVAFSDDVKRANQAGLNLQDIYTQNIVMASRKLQDPNTSLAEKQRWLKVLNDSYVNSVYHNVDLMADVQRQVEITDPKRQAAAWTTMALDATLAGVGFPGAKQIAGKFLEEGAKSGFKSIGGLSLKSGALTAPYGGAQPIMEKGSGATASDIAKGTATGFATGAVAGPVIIGGGGLLGATFKKTIGRLVKTQTPAQVKKIIPEISDETAQVIASTENPDLIQAVLQVDEGLKLSPAQRQRLQEEGISRVRLGEAEAGAYYKKGGEITLRNQEFARDDVIYHELGHHIWETRLTPEERRFFASVDKGPLKSKAESLGRTGYSLESEDFSDYIAKALTGKLSQVPKELRALISRYAKVMEAQAKGAGVSAKQLAKTVEKGPPTPLPRPAGIAPTGVIPETIAQPGLTRAEQGTLPQLPNAQKEQLDGVARQLGLKNSDELIQVVERPQAPSNISQAVPEEELASRMEREAVETKELYKEPGIKEKAKSFWDPRYRAVELDRKYAKATDRKINDVPAPEKLDAALEQSEQAKQIAKEYLKDSNIGKVIGKYGAEGQSATEFNTYRIFMRDLEQRSAGRPAIVRGVSDAEMRNWVSQYEARNPGARQDLKALVNDIEAVQDLAVNSEGRFLAPEELQAARVKPDGGRYEFFTPVQRAVPEGTERPQIGVNNVGTLGRQKVLQEFTGSDIPIDPTFNALTDYVETVYRQLGQSRAVKLYSQRTQQGLTGAKIIRTGDDTARLKQMQDTFRELGEIQQSLGRQKVRTGLKAGFAGREARTSQKAATNRMRQILRDTVDDPDAQAVIPNLKDDELIDLLKIANEPDIRNTPNVRKIYQNFIKKSENHRKLVEQLQDIKMDMESIRAARQGLSKNMVELRLDTRGRQVIAGLDENGNMFKIEVPPEDATMLQGLDRERLNDILRATHAAQTPFRQAFTGIINPGFQVAQATFNAVMAPFISRRGLRVYSPSSVFAGVKSLFGRDEFTQALRSRGVIRYGGGFEQLTSDTTVQALAARVNTFTRAKWYANPRRAWRALESLGGKLDQMARTATAKAEQKAAIRAGLSNSVALDNAVYAYNNVLPNFRNLSTAVRGVDSLLLYTGASQAGTRTLLRSFRNDPIRQVARLGVLGTGIAGIVGYSLAHEKGKEFYDDMRNSKKEYIIDNNVVVVLPWASKNKQTGEWEGIFKLPVPPEMRPFNRAINQAIYDGKEGIPVKQLGMALFDFVTGQSRTLNNPVVQLYASLTGGKDIHTGREIIDESMTDEEKMAAKQKFALSSFGVVGQALSGGELSKIPGSITSRFTGAKGLSSGGQYYRDEDDSIKQVGLNENELNAYKSVIAPRSKDLAGKSIKDRTFYDSANKAITWLRYPKTFEVSKLMDQKRRSRGELGDPLYDLSPEQLKTVLNMQANYSPGNFEEKAILKLNPWLKDFNEKRSAFYDQIQQNIKVDLDNLRQQKNQDEETKERIKKMEESVASFGIDPMGMTIPKADNKLQAKLDKIEKITDSAERAAFYADNPDVTDFYTQSNNYTRTKRAFLGLPQFDDYPTASPEVQKLMDSYFKLPSKNGPLKKDGTPSSPQRSAWIKSHPKEWASMVEQWTKQDIYNLQKEGATAVYEGIDFSEKGIKSILDIAKAAGGSGGFGGFGETTPTINITNLLGALGETPVSTPKLRFRSPGYSKLVPSAGRTRGINIKSLTLPSRVPKFSAEGNE